MRQRILYKFVDMAENRWQGFTEDDIKRLSTRTALSEDSKVKLQSQSKIVKKEIVKDIGRKNVIRERMLQHKRNLMLPATNADDMPDEARLSVIKKEVSSKCNAENLPLLSEVSSDSGCGISNGTDSSLSTSSDISSTDTSPSHGQVYLRIKEDKSYEVISHDQLTNSSLLNEFQIKHKMMEEQNKRRKELLAKALADRKKQTHEEARRLQQIQDELQKLDILLSNDVSILRNQIEAASLEFMEAQKRYNRAEKEFLEAKLCLFGKLERKELLTEHLCTIIEQNEMRKARKLSELMDKLELSTSIEMNEEEKKNVNGNMILSPLRALDEVSYTTCNTLKNRQGTAINENSAIDNELKTFGNGVTSNNSEKFCVSSGIPPALPLVSDCEPIENSNVPQEGDIPEEICLAPKE